MDDNFHIRKLLGKYLSNTCTKQEMQELLGLLKRAKYEPLIKRVLDEYWQELLAGNVEMGIGSSSSLSRDAEERFNEIWAQSLLREREGAGTGKHRPGARVVQAETKKPALLIPSHRRSGQWISIAAILVVSLVLSLFYYTLMQEEPANTVVYEQKMPGPGEKVRFVLPDGTQVHLNSESRLEYPVAFDGSIREVHLEGEAYFVVARDEARPFLVHTEEVTTRVLGTSFNVRSYPGDEQVVVAVASGKVAVLETGTPDLNDAGEAKEVVLGANQWADYTRESRRFRTGSGNIYAFTAWNEGVLLYHDKELGDVAVQFERWYGVDITFENEAIKRCVIRGEHRDESLVNVLEAITYAFVDMEYEIDGRQVVLKGKGCR